MHKLPTSPHLWMLAAGLGLLLAFFAYGGNEQGWMSNAVAVPLALLGVLWFAAVSLAAALRHRSSGR